MSFGFRKSLQAGPFRVTFSKLGASLSVGKGGARLTAGPRGTHVSFSKGGFYYRTRIGGGKTDASGAGEIERPEQSPQPAPPPATSSPESRPSAPVPGIFGDATTSGAVVEEINRRIRRRNYAWLIAIGVFAVLFAISLPWPVAAAAALACFVLFTIFFRRSRVSSLHYAEDEETRRRFDILRQAVGALHSGGAVWSVQDASYANGLTARPATVTRATVTAGPLPLPKYLSSNLTPPALQFPEGALYFLPDLAFVWHGGRFSTIDYPNLALKLRRVNFLERESPPTGAALVGSLRRSLQDTSTLPVLSYAYIDMDASPTLQANLLAAHAESAAEFVTRVGSLAGGAAALQTAAHSGATPEYTHFNPAKTPLYYQLSDNKFNQWSGMRTAFAALSRSDCVWRLEETTEIRTRVVPGITDSPPGVESNAAFEFTMGDLSLLLLPDACLLRAGVSYQPLGERLTVNAGTVDMAEEQFSPRDGRIVAKTWRHATKSGDPDQRYSDNPQISAYRYGTLEFRCGPWSGKLCLSSPGLAAEFESAFRAASRQ